MHDTFNPYNPHHQRQYHTPHTTIPPPPTHKAIHVCSIVSASINGPHVKSLGTTNCPPGTRPTALSNGHLGCLARDGQLTTITLPTHKPLTSNGIYNNSVYDNGAYIYNNNSASTQHTIPYAHTTHHTIRTRNTPYHMHTHFITTSTNTTTHTPTHTHTDAPPPTQEALAALLSLSMLDAAQRVCAVARDGGMWAELARVALEHLDVERAIFAFREMGNAGVGF